MIHPLHHAGRSLSAVVGSLAVVAALTAVVAPAGTADAAAGVKACSAGTTVQTSKGAVCGTTKAGVTTYERIPYAAPPVGDLRWRAPQPAEAWSGTLVSTTPAKECPSPGVPGGPAVKPGTSEDCLSVRVQRPADARPGERLPVMYETHGGGFLGESRTDNGENLVTGGRVVYVFVGYRLGILGFLASAALGQHSGDYGLQDQQAGLRWVRQNIGRFGGDPRNVTVFGESAGGASVCAQVASPTARGLFQKGISVSGFYNYQHNNVWSPADCKTTWTTEEDAQQTGASYAEKVGCDPSRPATEVAACLRAVPVARLVREGGQFADPDAGGTIGPIVNGTTITMSPAEAFATGQVNDVAMITDAGRDEFNGGIYQNYPGRNLVVADTEDQFHQLVEREFGDLAPTVERLYPLSAYASPFVAHRTIMADSATVCPLLRADEELSEHIPVHADLDVYDDSTRAEDSGLLLGALHSLTNLLVHDPISADAGEAALQRQLIAEWTQFARTGNPSAPGTPAWPTYDVAQQVLALRPAGASGLVSASAIADQHHCAFWDRVTHY